MKKRSLIFFAGLAVALVIFLIYLMVKPDAARGHYYKVLCLGDSLTESSYGQYPRTLKYIFKAKNLKVNVYSAARPGNNSGEYLQYLKGSNILDKIKPHILILMLGTNDVRSDSDFTPVDRFKKNMREILAIIKGYRALTGNPGLIFLATILPIFNCDLATFDETSRHRVRKEIVPAIRRLAREEGVRLLDLFEFFAKKPDLLPGIHPGKAGYRAMAEFIFEEIRPYIKGAK